MIDLGNSTNLSADEAAEAIAQLYNVMGGDIDTVDQFASALVDLGNNAATTESDILNMATRIASSASMIGMSEQEVLALATTLASVGLEAEGGGSAISTVMTNIDKAVDSNSETLKVWADTAGMSVSEFSDLWKNDVMSALQAVISGMSDTTESGESLNLLLDDLGVTSLRQTDTMKRLSQASELLADMTDLSNEAWEDNSALTTEANKRYETLASQITIAVNKIKDIAITLGNKLMPYIQDAIDKVGELAEWFDGLSDSQAETIVKIGLFVAAAGPLIAIIGKITSTTGTAIKGIGTLSDAIQVMKGTTTSTSTAVNSLASGISVLTNPTVLLTAAVVAGVAAMTAYHASVISEQASLEGLRDEIDEQTEAWNELATARNETLTNSMSEIESCELLYNELTKITDENGKVKEGYENRAQVILTTLNEALGTEYSMNDGIISQYKQLQSEINDVISSKKAEAVLTAYQDEYTTALTNQAEATQNLANLREQLVEAQKSYLTATGTEKAEAKALVTELGTAIEEQTALIGEYGYTIENYEALQVASLEGTSQAIDEAVQNMCVSYEEAKTASELSIEEQIADQKEYISTLKQLLSEAKASNDQYYAGVLETQLESAEEQLNTLQGTLSTQSAMLQTSADEATTITATFGENLNLSGEISDEMINTEAMMRVNTGVANAAAEVASEADSSFTSNVDGKEWANDLISETSTNLKSTSNLQKIKNAALSVANTIKSILGFSLPEEGPLSDFDESMPDMIDLMAEGIRKNKDKVTTEAQSLAHDLDDALGSVNTSASNNTIASKNNYNSTNQSVIIDYEKLTDAIIKALTNCKLSLDEDGFARIIKEELYKVV